MDIKKSINNATIALLTKFHYGLALLSANFFYVHFFFAIIRNVTNWRDGCFCAINESVYCIHFYCLVYSSPCIVLFTQKCCLCKHFRRKKINIVYLNSCFFKKKINFPLMSTNWFSLFIVRSFVSVLSNHFEWFTSHTMNVSDIFIKTDS